MEAAGQPRLTLDVPPKTSGARPRLRGGVSSSAGLPRRKIPVETGSCLDLGPANQWMKKTNKRVENGLNNFANVVIAGLTQKSRCLCVALSAGESKGSSRDALRETKRLPHILADCLTYLLVSQLHQAKPSLISFPNR